MRRELKQPIDAVVDQLAGNPKLIDLAGQVRDKLARAFTQLA